ncbi:MAG: beta-N-acetylhexosaminidase [Deltaproteobacteria bacterium]|nr:beta-N-acetylhexosaminidase [Deltaproteobacteria bacterium]MBW2600941.1 beta-N-acetylhexosaminidase [Deltaproteobacteria bacterium]OEU45797.1 MAG: hypothetical protein BBJ60_09325 [Desulfobacterales bacterium S7086C20]
MIHPHSLTNEQLAGQRLMVGFKGKVLDDALRFMITKLCVGGLVLFRRNVTNPSQLSELCQNAQDLATQIGNPPLLIAIDQEGGPVARLDPPFTVFPGNLAIGNARSIMAARKFGEITAKELKEVGITLNFAPVLDVIPEGFDSSIMADRAFGNSPGLAGDLGKTVIESLQENGVGATAKHFPGIGRTTIDSHADLPFLETKGHILDSLDLIPFKAAIQSNVAAVMLSHVVYTDLDPTWPASLSSIIAKKLLRNTMGFKGVSITDDLDMGAIDKHFDVDTFVERICDAGIDIALICHDQHKIETTHAKLLKAIQTSDHVKKLSLKSVGRILRLKAEYPPLTHHRNNLNGAHP